MNIGDSINLDRVKVTRRLERLHEIGVVMKRVYKGKTIFYPRGLRDDDMELAFSQLKHDTRKDIFLHVLDNPGCHQNAIVNRFWSTSKRQVFRLLDSLVDARLLSRDADGSNVRYRTGDVGKRIVLGSIESVDPFVQSIRDQTGQDVTVSVDGNTVHLELERGDIISFQIGKWSIMSMDDETIYKNKYVLLGEGGEQVLVSIYSGCNNVDEIRKTTAIPAPVIRHKVETLRRMGMVAGFDATDGRIEMTELGKNVVERILHVKK